MKKRILPLLAAVLLAFSFSACEHQTLRTGEVTIYASQWVTNETVDYYYCTVPWDELTPEVVDYGLVNVYYLNPNGQQDMLPLVTPMFYDLDGDGIAEYPIAENIRFDIEYGFITFIIEDMDGVLPGDMAGTQPLSFRMVALGD